MAKPISIIDKVFDSKTLASMYYSNKIKYNPKDYSFKDSLKAVDLKGGVAPIACLNYDSETFLKGILQNNGFKIVEMSWASKLTAEHLSTHGLDYPRLISGTPCFIKHDDMYFKPELFLRYQDLSRNTYPKGSDLFLNKLNLEKIKTDDEFNALMQLHIALANDASIAKYLIWLTTEYAAFPLEELCNLDFIIRQLEGGAETTFIRAYTEDAAMFLPVYTEGKGLVADTFEVLGMTPAGRTLEVSKIAHNSYAKCIIFGLEVLHMLYTIPNPKHVNVLERLLASNANEINGIEKFLYAVTPTGIKPANEFVQKIIDCADPKKRFELISMYTTSIDIWREAFLRVSDPIKPLPYVAEWLLETCAYCNELAVYDMRVKYLSILYKFCQDKGWLDELLDEDPEAMSSFMEDLEDTFKAVGADAPSSVADSTSLMDLSTGKPYTKSAPPSGPTADVSPTIEALDKLKASYSDDKYKFDVKDVVKTTPIAKYLDIASHVDLLNKSLIKRIKDIKVYNTGGKNAGMSKGKLDRKALYRYKTCKDIFYDNTYKVKECDLAFGLILDVSGSMAGKGIENGTATMIILHETLKALGINHSIITHTSDGKYHSEINRYQAFKEDKTYSTLKNYALGDIDACWGNCDSGALFYMEKALSRVRNKDKICIMFSDGEPTECSGTDLKEQVKKMERQGIKVIGVGINYSNIKNYYTEYANGKNLAEMFDIIADILKRYVLEKED